MAEKKVAIVIHVYKEELTSYEQISLVQLTRVLGKYPVILTAPIGFKALAYQQILNDQLVKIIEYPHHYFKDLHGYNHLLLSKSYYQALLGYEYILLHHTDAFVFKDELKYWMDKELDYIGAPIYAYNGTINPTEFICTGNGGFSLRKVESFYKLADSKQVIFKWSDIVANFKLYSLRGRVARLPYYLGLLATYQARMNSQRRGVRENEDIIWGKYVSKYIPSFKVAGFEDAYRFGMEFNCDQLLQANQGALPFGCHGWYKELFIGFWSRYIREFGYEI